MTPFPIDWDEWRTLWREWVTAHQDDLKPTRKRFPGKNFLADEILGTWLINGQLIELSSVTFPNLEERNERGFLIDKRVRSIGITTEGEDGRMIGGVVKSFEDLERELGLA